MDSSIEHAKVVTLPNILNQWPWRRRLSEHFQDAKAESTAWVEAFRPFRGRALQSFRKCDFSLLASLTYSPREKELIRLGCDLMNLFFVFDEYTDVEDRDGVQVIHQKIQDIFMNPGDLPPRKENCVFAVARDFWRHARAQVPEDASCLQHFLDTWTEYTAAVVQEADDRAKKRYRSFDDYMKIRRNTAGGGPTLALIEFGLDLPEEVYYHPVISSLREKAEILIVLVNDIYSYIMEKSRGLATHNGVEILIHERHITLQNAMDWLGDYCNEIAEAFLADMKSVPSWGADVDTRVFLYIDGLGQWVRGIDDWHFESARYFGSEAAIVKQTRVATITPPSRGYVTLSRKTGQGSS
ncbi:hypothetical protein NP233_g482 [Leucocoprinus birnbaumii]|uniref:Terpene synthase n=1 Tax=Leucocoprinus birnbaumii TaxID=56174 RepID=A0AAD5Z0A8_9AGAR|nr:hypothetical protein NP233_g482 [Leucocoprinus birnbaumii]